MSLSGYEFGELDPENPDSEMDDAILKLVKDTADHLEEHLYPAGGKISKLAEEHNMVIVATGPMCCSDPMGREGYYDGAVVFHPDGTVDPRRVFKVNLWGYSERNWFRNPHFGDNFSEDASKSAFHVFEANEFPFSVGICFDADFPENSRCMALNGSFLNCFPTASPSVILPGQTEPYPDIREHHIPANSLQNQNFCSYGNRAQYEYVKTGENEYTCVLEYDGNSVITNPYGGQLVAAPDKGQYILIADCVICDYPSTQPPGVNYMTNRRPEVYGLLTAPTVPFPHGSPNGYTYETPVPDGKEPEVPPHDYPSVCPVPLTGSGE